MERAMSIAEIAIAQRPRGRAALDFLEAILPPTACVYLDGTRLTAAGVKKLEDALPNCRIRLFLGLDRPAIVERD